ncbi:chaplin [Streptomyces inhibens]|uniref:Chaplin n=1 Tax=Streptomyces inhibens TaxID=2293571 RepID=A0A371PYU1_STRIH|nr:chaplin [Streptomyces inhibens]
MRRGQSGRCGRCARWRRRGGCHAELPGVVSGNLIQVPVDVPVNICGSTVNIVTLLNPAFGNNCLNR